MDEIDTGARPAGLYFWFDAAQGIGMVAAAAIALPLVLRNSWDQINGWIGDRITEEKTRTLIAAATTGLITAMAGAFGTVLAKRSGEYLGETGAMIASFAPIVAWAGVAALAWAVVTGVSALVRGSRPEAG